MRQTHVVDNRMLVQLLNQQLQQLEHSNEENLSSSANTDDPAELRALLGASVANVREFIRQWGNYCFIWTEMHQADIDKMQRQLDAAAKNKENLDLETESLRVQVKNLEAEIENKDSNLNILSIQLKDTQSKLQSSVAEIEWLKDLEPEVNIDDLLKQVDEVNQLRGQLAAKDAELEKLYKILGNNIIELLSDSQALLSLVRENSKALSASVRMRAEDKRGANSPAYRHDINNDSLVSDYQAAGCSITGEMLNKYNSSWMTLKKRLQSLGVYQGRASK